MSRLGEALYRAVRPFPRIAAALHYLRHPRLFVHKTAQLFQRKWRLRAYRQALKNGKLLVEVPGGLPSFLITVATPVYRVAEEHLRAAIASVRSQTYPHWELILLDDASPDAHVKNVLREASAWDPRIRVVHQPSNLGIALASNEIIRLARGEYVAFLDHDDLLHPRALEQAARFLAGRPDVDWLFTDEDKVDERGQHSEPCFKPGWSHHLLLTFNYVCHLRIVRRSILQRVGGHRPGFDGAQDYDLALRVIQNGGRFAHLPGVLYHWRTVASSMARAAAAKPAAHTHALRALAEHAASWPTGGEVSAEVLLAPASFFRVRRMPPEGLSLALLSPDPPRLSGLRGFRMEWVEVHPGLLAPEELAQVARASTAEVLVVPPPQGFSETELQELLSLLQVPKTALVCARACRGKTVLHSGWVASDTGELRDPWRGLDRNDPGYLNLAMVPGPRLVPTPQGFVVWRQAVVAAMAAAEDVPAPWKLPLGWHRLGLEVVATPTVSYEAGEIWAAPQAPLPAEAPVHMRRWLDEFGLVPAPRF